jgi:DNA-binding transcriptional LysR family regulator
MFAKNMFTHVQPDLNLLTALDALLEEGSVTGAAQRLYLTTPAMSRTLGRIRHVTGDPILVRSGRHMTPTPYAVDIRSEVRAIVSQAHAVLRPKQALDVATLDRTFTLAGHDAITMTIGPQLFATIRTCAPGVVLRFLGEATVDTDDLRVGRVDLEIGSTTPTLPDVSFEAIGTDNLVVALRRGHPLTKGSMTVDRYATAHHITISRRGRLHDPIDDALALHGKQRRVVAAVPTLSAALQFVRNSDLIVSIASRVGGQILDEHGLTTIPIPLELPLTTLTMSWHRRNNTDLAHVWMRDQVRNALVEMGENVPRSRRSKTGP